MVSTGVGRWSRSILLGAVMLILVTSCGGRPDLDSWDPKWLELAETVTGEISAAAPPEREACDHLLGRVRAGLPELRPAPNDVVGAAVDAWGEFAESVLFECPLVRGEHAGWDAAVLELQRLRAEIDAEIDFERSRD